MVTCKIMKTMLGEEAESEINKVPVFDSTVSRSVGDMGHIIIGILSHILQNTNFAPQVDDTTDITS